LRDNTKNGHIYYVLDSIGAVVFFGERPLKNGICEPGDLAILGVLTIGFDHSVFGDSQFGLRRGRRKLAVYRDRVLGAGDANWQFALPLQFSNESFVERWFSRRRIGPRSGIRRGRRKLAVCVTSEMSIKVNTCQ
jgi:hypothetical protein